MPSSFDELRTVNLGSVVAPYERASEGAFMLARCSTCASSQMAVVARSHPNPGRAWLSCVECGTPHSWNEGSVSPSTPPLATPEGVGGDELAVWMEIRNCLGIGAYTAAVMMCRKMLFHLAVSNGLPPKAQNGHAPSFAQAVKHLEAEGIVTVRMRPWVDRIRDIGNDANHELAAIGEKNAMDVARFTEQLLRLSFEMDSLVNAATYDESDLLEATE